MPATLEELYTMWTLQIVLGDKRIVFRYQEANSSYNNVVFWMYEHIAEVETILDRHVNDEPKVVIYDQGFDPA